MPTVSKKEKFRELVARVLEQRYELVPLPEEGGKEWRLRTAADEIVRPRSALPAVKSDEAEEKESTVTKGEEPVLPIVPNVLAKRHRSKRAVRVFEPAMLEHATVNMKKGNSDLKNLMKLNLESASENEGYRDVPNFTRFLRNDYNSLKQLFENFSSVLEFLRGEMVLNTESKPEAFRITPILLDGAPGVGKTAFAQAIAKALGLPFVKFTAGGMQHGAALSGTGSHWSNTEPGEVFKLLARNKSATPIILFDEADKLSDRQDYSILPALLDLLEPESSCTYRDVCLGMTFDASHLIVLLTSNSVKEMNSALLSRCKVFTIKAPEVEQKRLVVQNVCENINRNLPKSKRLTLDMDAVDKMIQAKTNIRALIQAVRAGAVEAIDSRCGMLKPVIQPEVQNKIHSMGFV